jgi:hypothetical protein
MPYFTYALVCALCPWPNCGFRIENVDFQLEFADDRTLYSRVVQKWASDLGYGIVARCPGCHQWVWFGRDEKRTVSDPPPADADVLPDDWHRGALIV